MQNTNGVDMGFQLYPSDPTQLDRDGQQSFGDSVFMGANTPSR